MKIKLKEDDKWTWWDEFKLNVEFSFPIKHTKKLYYYIRSCLITKCHLINTRLKKGHWYDTDYRLLYGMMNLFMEFLEKEKPYDRINWNSDDFHKHAKDEMVAINSWWLNYEKRLKNIEDARNDWHDDKFKDCRDDLHGWIDRINEPSTPETERKFQIIQDLEKKLDEEETEMLIRLIKIRKFLWT